MTPASPVRKTLPNHAVCAILLLFGLLVPGRQAYAQPIIWQQSDPFPGIRWLRYDGSINNHQQWINVLLIDTTRISLCLISDGKKLKPLSHFADTQGAVAAINGTFFHPEEGGSVCYTRVNGITTDTTRSDLPSRWFLPELDDGALVNDSTGWKIVLTPPGGWESSHYRTIISAGPPLIMNQKPLPLPDHSFSTKRYGRTAIGFTTAGTMVWMTVSGREPSSTGFTLAELQQLMRQLDCSEALNLDGGSSTSLWINQMGAGSIVTDPKGKPAPRKKIANALVAIPVH